MHGRKRAPKYATPDAAAEAAAAELQKKVEKLKGGLKMCIHNHHRRDYSPSAMEISAKVLAVNPEYYTVWNYRREAIQTLIDECLRAGDMTKAAVQFDQELSFLQAALSQQPKCYAIWNHRGWVVDQAVLYGAGPAVGPFDLNQEIGLCDKLLTLDERNFHCWVYRSRLARKAGRSVQQEFDMTTQKINENFSNFSAWHFRSGSLPKLIPLEVERRPEAMAMINSELDKLKNAFWCEPSDQSAWLYHRWLLDYAGRLQVEFKHGMRIAEAEDLVRQFGAGAGAGVGTSTPRAPYWAARHQRAAALCAELAGAKVPVDLLAGEIDTCNELVAELADEEPRMRKWVLHTLAGLLRLTGNPAHLARVCEIYAELATTDPARERYYNDKRSSTVLESALRGLEGGRLDVSNRRLTRFLADAATAVTLGSVTEINASHNPGLQMVGEESAGCPVKRLLGGVQRLDLSHCGIASVKTVSDLVRHMPALRDLDLRGNPVPDCSGVVPRSVTTLNGAPRS